MENDIMENLKDIGYEGPMNDQEIFLKCLTEGAKNIEFTRFISDLTKELRYLCNIDESVNTINSPEDSISFLLELSSFLKELGCPYENLTQGHMSVRLTDENDKMILIEYLITELMAARIIKSNNPEKNMEVKVHESANASNLKQILQALKFGKPPGNVTINMLYQKMIPKLQETIKRAGDELVGRPLWSGTLNDQQWMELEKIQTDFDKEYTIRREMLLKRLDCTIQSFQWSEKLKNKEDKLVQIYYNKRRNLKASPDLRISDILAARDDLAIIEKTSNASVRLNTKTELNKLIIGKVPDRGGRPSEQAPPPPEMPSWQQRSAPGSGGGGRGGRGGQSNYHRGGGGGSGGNQQSNSFDNRTNYESNYGGNYNDNYGGGNYQQQNFDYQSGRGSYGNRGGGRSFESFQINKTTYADQYVQDSQHNKQYSGRDYDSPRGQRRGRSNYNRGGYR